MLSDKIASAWSVIVSYTHRTKILTDSETSDIMNYENARPHDRLDRPTINNIQYPDFSDTHFVKRADYYDARNPFLTDFRNTYPFSTAPTPLAPWHEVNPFGHVKYYQISDHRGAFSMEW